MKQHVSCEGENSVYWEGKACEGKGEKATGRQGERRGVDMVKPPMLAVGRQSGEREGGRRERV